MLGAPGWLATIGPSRIEVSKRLTGKLRGCFEEDELLTALMWRALGPDQKQPNRAQTQHWQSYCICVSTPWTATVLLTSLSTAQNKNSYVIKTFLLTIKITDGGSVAVDSLRKTSQYPSSLSRFSGTKWTCAPVFSKMWKESMGKETFPGDKAGGVDRV